MLFPKYLVKLIYVYKSKNSMKKNLELVSNSDMFVWWMVNNLKDYFYELLLEDVNFQSNELTLYSHIKAKQNKEVNFQKLINYDNIVVVFKCVGNIDRELDFLISKLDWNYKSNNLFNTPTDFKWEAHQSYYSTIWLDVFNVKDQPLLDKFFDWKWDQQDILNELIELIRINYKEYYYSPINNEISDEVLMKYENLLIKLKKLNITWKSSIKWRVIWLWWASDSEIVWHINRNYKSKNRIAILSNSHKFWYLWNSNVNDELKRYWLWSDVIHLIDPQDKPQKSNDWNIWQLRYNFHKWVQIDPNIAKKEFMVNFSIDIWLDEDKVYHFINIWDQSWNWNIDNHKDPQQQKNKKIKHNPTNTETAKWEKSPDKI